MGWSSSPSSQSDLLDLRSDRSNDLFSPKKELRKGGVDSIVPIAYDSGMSGQAAVDKAVDDLESSVARFDADVKTTLNEAEQEALALCDQLGDGHDALNDTGADLFAPGNGEPSRPQAFQKFVQCHQLIFTGITRWR